MRLLMSAVKGGLLECLSPQRVRAELELILKESCFRKIMSRMSELGVWEGLFPGIQLGPSLEQRLRAMEHLMAEVREGGIEFKGMEWLVSMAVLFSDSVPNVRASALDRMNLTPVERRELTLCFSDYPQVERFCSTKKPPRNSDAYLFLKDYGPVQMLYWMTCLKSESARSIIITHMQFWTTLKGELTGHDLIKMGLEGQSVGKALSGIRLARMDGLISSREGEIAYVQNLLAHRMDV